ncbi:MAG: ATPase [Bacteroidaceae bacterium]|nr:ATPase [Bacteroidaceae bacterium]
MKLIADSGSTKTAWCLFDANNHKVIITQGINPYQQSEQQIADILHQELQHALPENSIIEEVFFYGAGCTPEKSPIVQAAIRSLIHEARIYIGSDMLGAARSLCKHETGIVGILGTGANSCFYDGENIIKNVSPLGFILGDEGSGGYIGKRLVGDCLKDQLTDNVKKMFLEETHETAATIIQKVYREPMPNRFLASLSPFCARHREEPSIHALLIDCFQQFFIRNIYAYNDLNPTLRTINFVGSIAKIYEQELTEAAESLGYNIGTIVQTPLEGLYEYHK